jgi:hypothetical protein
VAAALSPTRVALSLFSATTSRRQCMQRFSSERVLRWQCGHSTASAAGTGFGHLNSRYQAIGPVRAESPNQTQKRRFFVSEATRPVQIAATIQTSTK